MGSCFIFGSGEYDGATPQISEGDFIIAADGGYAWLREQGITPDLLVGDFDSLGYVPEGIEIIRHPVMKDDTDMTLSVKEGIARGYGRFLIYGGLGGRLDHTMANIQLIAGLARRGITSFLISEAQTITAISGCGVKFSPECTGIFSAFSYGGKALGVTEKGFLYELNDAKLSDDVPMGVSNEFTGREASISVREGTLILMWQGNLDKKLPGFYTLSGAGDLEFAPEEMQI